MINIADNIKITKAIQFAIDRLNQVIGLSLIKDEIELILLVDDKLVAQGYNRIIKANTVTISGGDEAGIMYGVLDLSRDISHGKGLESIGDTKVSPYLSYRGIKFNIPLDARTPSYSDASDTATYNIENMWDISFWTEFLDRMALERYNVLSLWSLSPFPSMVRIHEYPLTALDDVKMSTRPAKADLSGFGTYAKDMSKSLVTLKKMSIDEKISFWQSVMEYAKERCIKIFLFTWNLFTYGVENNPYGITCDQNNSITKDYIYCATKSLMETYPLLSGIGVTSGENMLKDDTDIPFIANSYGRGVKDYLKEHPKRDFRFIHRMQYTRYDSIIKEFKEFPCPFEISFKYSQAHMYSSTKPAFIDSFLKEKERNIDLWLTVRNDDFYMYRWGNPEYARDYLRQMPIDVMTGYYMGADGYTWGRDYMDLRDKSHPLFIAKMWYMFMIWGQLSYNIKLPDKYFSDELGFHLGIEPMILYESFKHASDIIPEFNRVHWHDYDFQWYPEGCCMYDFENDKIVFADINEFIKCPSMPGGGCLSVSEYCEIVNKGDSKALNKYSPQDMAESIIKHADKALAGVECIRNNISTNESIDINNNELLYTLDDIEALSYLGYYYAYKLQAAVSLCSYRMKGEKEFQENAVMLLRKAASLWARYSSKSKQMYKPQVFNRLCGYVDVQRFDRQAQLDALLAIEE